jgi:hypothetical protein
MNWGKGIILSFVLFAIFIGYLVYVCVRQDISLVSKNYYQEELAYQEQIDRMGNSNALPQKPVVRISEGKLLVEFNQFQDMKNGKLILFRPSEEKFDKHFLLLSTPMKSQEFDVSQLPKGMYRLKMSWSMGGKGYYLEKEITL